MVRTRRLATSLLATFALACADDGKGGADEVGESRGSETSGESGETSSGASTSETSSGETGTGTDTSTGETSTSDTGTDSTTGETELPMLPLCGMAPPDGAELAPPLPTYGGTCPILDTSGPVLNYIQSGGGERSFIVVAPSDLAEDEVLPVMFMYHWLGGSADDFYERAEAQAAADYYRFIAIIPNGRDVDQLVPFKWPFAVSDLDFLMEQDFELFDDMLACVAEQFAVDKECVSTMGVSAGALFSSMLASRHGDALSSYISLSGGVGGLIKPWQPGGNIMPAMVLWGGDMDFCIAINFANTSKQLEMDLEANGHPVVECIHNCTHATPPLDPPADMPDLPIFACTWEFMLAHPYWLDDGYSPYSEFDAMPSPFPEWCAYGAGNAVERVGECNGSECQ